MKTRVNYVKNIEDDTTCDHSCAKKAIAARNQDHIAWLAHGKVHMITCYPPRAKKATVVLNQGYTAQLAHNKTCVIKRKGNQYNKKVNHISHCI